MLITEVEVLKEENHSDKHVYAITDAGRKKLPEKIYELFEKSKSFGELMLPAISLQYVDKERVIHILQEKIMKVEKAYAQITTLQKNPIVQREKLFSIALFDQYVEDTFMKELTYLKQFINELR